MGTLPTAPNLPESLQPVRGYKWVLVTGVALLWMLGGLLVFPSLAVDGRALIVYEVFWSGLCLSLMLLGLSSLGVRLTAEGISKRGILREINIRWDDAQVSQEGYYLKIRSTSATIYVNPFVFASQDALGKFVAYYARQSREKPRGQV